MSDKRSSPSFSLERVLADWDGKDLMEGVRLISKHREINNLKELLEITTEVGAYQLHVHHH